MAREEIRGRGRDELVKAAQAVSEGRGVSGELDQAVATLEGDDLVGADVELATTTAFVSAEEVVDEGEELLHDGVLTDVVVALHLYRGRDVVSAVADEGKGGR